MEQLITSDNQNFGGAGPDHPNMAAGAVAVVNGPVPDVDLIKSLLSERIQPRLGTMHDIDGHVQRVALPQPGDETELFRAVAHALEHPLAVDRSPWECWIIEGLQDSRWAMLIKVHHRAADNLSAAHLLTRLCDDAGTDIFTNTAANKQISAPDNTPTSWVDAVRQKPASMFRAAARVISGASSGLAAATALLQPAVGPPATMRRYRTVRIPRADVDGVARKFGVSANEVALAAITESFRAVLMRRGEQPRAGSLHALGQVLPHLPVEHGDPIQQLRAVHHWMVRAGHTDQSASYSPFDLCTRAIQLLTRLPRQGIVTLSTTSPGPQRQLRLMGRRMELLLPIPPTAHDLSTGVAVLSYGNELIFGITAGYHAGSEIEQVAAGIEAGMARLLALSHDSILLFERRRKRKVRVAPNNAARWRPSAPPARVRH